MQNPAQAQGCYDIDFENTGFEPPFRENFGGTSASMDLYASKSAYDEMDCLLDNDFAMFESRLPWAIPDIFPRHRSRIEVSSSIAGWKT